MRVCKRVAIQQHHRVLLHLKRLKPTVIFCLAISRHLRPTQSSQIGYHSQTHHLIRKVIVADQSEPYSKLCSHRSEFILLLLLQKIEVGAKSTSDAVVFDSSAEGIIACHHSVTFIV